MERYQQVTQERDALRADRDAIVEEAHRRLDEAGVPSALGATCDDPACQTQIGHRIKVLGQELGALRQRVAALEEALRDFLHLLDGQTEPLHPVSWLATVEAGKRALLSGEAPTE